MPMDPTPLRTTSALHPHFLLLLRGLRPLAPHLNQTQLLPAVEPEPNAVRAVDEVRIPGLMWELHGGEPC